MCLEDLPVYMGGRACLEDLHIYMGRKVYPGWLDADVLVELWVGNKFGTWLNGNAKIGWQPAQKHSHACMFGKSADTIGQVYLRWLDAEVLVEAQGESGVWDLAGDGDAKLAGRQHKSTAMHACLKDLHIHIERLVCLEDLHIYVGRRVYLGWLDADVLVELRVGQGQLHRLLDFHDLLLQTPHICVGLLRRLLHLDIMCADHMALPKHYFA